MPDNDVILDEMIQPAPAERVGLGEIIAERRRALMANDLAQQAAIPPQWPQADNPNVRPRGARLVRNMIINNHAPFNFQGLDVQGNAVNPVRVMIMDDLVQEVAPAPRKKEVVMNRGTLGYAMQRAIDGMFGYELEVEGDNLPRQIEGWSAGKDGSLRGENAEYTIKEPQNIEQMVAAFQLLVKKLSRDTTKLSFSFRTSTHVHLNVLPLTKDQIHSLFYLSHLVEDVLVNYSGPSRVGNRFCLRTKDAEAKIETFKQWLLNRGFGRLSQEELKYSAINIATIPLYGSIEFRSLRATTDEKVVVPWLSALKNLYDIAVIVPIKEIEEIARNKPAEILNVVFKEHLPLFHYTGIENDVSEAYDRLIEIPYVKGVA